MRLNPPGSASAQWLNHAPRVEEVLQRVFRLADSTWARDFLFHPNSAVDAGILTSPLHLQYKVAGQIRLNWIQERQPGPYNHEPYMDPDLSRCADDRLYADWIIVPAFNFGQQGACYFMHKEKKSKRNTNSASSQTGLSSGGGSGSTGDVFGGDDEGVDRNGAVRSALYRIITDDVTGEVLYVGDCPETDNFQVVHMRHVNGAFHERAMCFFEGSVFRAALTAAEDGGLSLAHLAKALTLCMHTRETRKCIVCGAHPSMLCNCAVPLKQAEHPHDLRFYPFNARTHLGQYSGKQYLMYMKNGMEIARRPELTQHCTDCEIDRDVAQALRNWAVQDRLGNVLRKPLASPKDQAVAEAMAEATRNQEEKTFDEVIDDLAAIDARIDARTVQGQWNAQLRATEVDLTTGTDGTNSGMQTIITSDPTCIHSTYLGTRLDAHDLTQRLEATHLVPESPTTPPNNAIRMPVHGTAHGMPRCYAGTPSDTSLEHRTPPSVPLPVPLPVPEQIAMQGIPQGNMSMFAAQLSVTTHPPVGSIPAVPVVAPTTPPQHFIPNAHAQRNGLPRGRRAPIRERPLLPRGNRVVVAPPAPKDRELELRIRKREAARRSDARRNAKVKQLEVEKEQLEQRQKELEKRKGHLEIENETLRTRVRALTLQ